MTGDSFGMLLGNTSVHARITFISVFYYYYECKVFAIKI